MKQTLPISSPLVETTHARKNPSISVGAALPRFLVFLTVDINGAVLCALMLLAVEGQ